ncbi:MAG: hypothetical protein LBI61_03020 [Puniceicoccales bacterium]|jgi:hypothetical protein|nr:hypothetical protein [Puniceicoccales bacterium]
MAISFKKGFIMTDVRIALDERANEALLKIFTTENAGDEGLSFDSPFPRKIVISVSSATFDSGVLDLSVDDVKPKRALTSRGAVVARGANVSEGVAAAASIAKGIYEFITGDKSNAITYIAAGAVGLFDCLKSVLIDTFKK